MSAGELGTAFGRQRSALVGAAVFSAAMNLLMLTGPLFMLQVHDRVLASRSEATLAVLTAIAVFLFAIMGLLDAVRGRVLSRAGAGLQADLDGRVLAAVLRQSAPAAAEGDAALPLRDLAAIRTALGSAAAGTLFDLPWAPVFVAVLFVLHPWLGWFALASGALLVGLALAGQRASDRPLAEAARLSAEAEASAGAARRSAEAVAGLGMGPAVVARWAAARKTALMAAVGGTDIAGGHAAAVRAVRLLVQSVVLALGAWLVLRGEITAGAMVAATILLGRALAPVEQAVGLWPQLRRAVEGWRSLAAFLAAAPEPAAPMVLPRPQALLEVRDLTLGAPGGRAPVLRGITFLAQGGDAVAVIGPSAAGKTALARALCGLWPPARGEARLGGVALDRLDEAARRRLVGYLPQDARLLPGTVAENIARFDPAAAPDDIVAAAQAAGAHRPILALAEGYGTRLAEDGAPLSGGQRRGVALARALYGNPLLLVLDEPDAGLDEAGLRGLNRAIARVRAAGGIVVVMSHRPAVLAVCNRVLVLEDGRQRAFGPRQAVLPRVLAPASADVPASAGRSALRAAGVRG